MEILTLLTLAKEAGFETGQILTSVVIYTLLQRTTKKEFDKLITAIQALEASHNRRLEDIEEKVGIKR